MENFVLSYFSSLFADISQMYISLGAFLQSSRWQKFSLRQDLSISPVLGRFISYSPLLAAFAHVLVQFLANFKLVY